MSPPDLVERARKTLGEIHLDAAAGATTSIGTLQNLRVENGRNGLLETWVDLGCETFFLNPPFGFSYFHQFDKRCYSADEFKKMTEEGGRQPGEFIKQSLLDWARATTGAAVDGMSGVWLARQSPCSVAGQLLLKHCSAICYPEGRVAYVSTLTGEAQKGPNFESWLLYFGALPECFRKNFADIGEVVIKAKATT